MSVARIEKPRRPWLCVSLNQRVMLVADIRQTASERARSDKEIIWKPKMRFRIRVFPRLTYDYNKLITAKTREAHHRHKTERLRMTAPPTPTHTQTHIKDTTPKCPLCATQRCLCQKEDHKDTPGIAPQVMMCSWSNFICQHSTATLWLQKSAEMCVFFVYGEHTKTSNLRHSTHRKGKRTQTYHISVGAKRCTWSQRGVAPRVALRFLIHVSSLNRPDLSTCVGIVWWTVHIRLYRYQDTMSKLPSPHWWPTRFLFCFGVQLSAFAQRIWERHTQLVFHSK